MMEIVISRIALHPIKSFDGITVNSATLLESGALMHDREFALCDENGRRINGKHNARLNLIRSEYDLERYTIRLRSPSRPNWRTFHLLEDRSQLEAWFTSELGIPVRFERDLFSGFPDDLHAKGPTIISTGTIAELSSWFAISDLNETRRRFRTNIELSVDIPFWEDRLFGQRGRDVVFFLGGVEIFGVGPCKRCVVPTRDSTTGDTTKNFQETFTSKRMSMFPAWASRARFGPLFYRVAINTRANASEAGKRISVGDRFQLSTME